MSAPDFPKFITSSVELLAPHAKRVMETRDDKPDETPEEADRDMAILGAYSNLLCLKTFLDNGLVEVVDGPQVRSIRAARKAQRDAGL